MGKAVIVISFEQESNSFEKILTSIEDLFKDEKVIVYAAVKESAERILDAADKNEQHIIQEG